TSGVPEADLNPRIDPDTDLPAAFSDRRLRSMNPGATLQVRKLLVRSDARRARGDLTGAAAALEEAVAADSTVKDAFRVLGMLYDQQGQFDKGRSAYER